MTPIYLDLDNVSGNASDSNSGASASEPLATLQWGLDVAGSQPPPPIAPGQWSSLGNLGFRQPNQLKLLPCSTNLQTQPAFFAGPNPVELVGAGASGDASAYQINCNSEFQCITAQDAVPLIISGITGVITGPDCTFINALRKGIIGIRNYRCGSTAAAGPTGTPIGMADHSVVTIFGNVSFFGAGFVSLFQGIDSELQYINGNIGLENVMPFGNLFGGSRFSIVTEGSDPTFTGFGAGCVGMDYWLWRLSYCAINYNSMPLSTGAFQGTHSSSSVIIGVPETPISP